MLKSRESDILSQSHVKNREVMKVNKRLKADLLHNFQPIVFFKLYYVKMYL